MQQLLNSNSQSFNSQGLFSSVIGSILDQRNTSSSVVDFIRNNLKYDIVQKFSSSLCRTKLQNTGVEGFKCMEIIVTTKCDLNSFHSLVQSLVHESRENSNHTFRFSPSLNSFSSQSRATRLLSVDFATLLELLRWISIHDESDVRRISLKSTSRKNDSLLRIVGSTAFLSLPNRGSQSSSLGIDCVFLFSSCTLRLVNHLESVLAEHLANPDNKSDLQTHSTTQYDYSRSSSGTQLVFYRCRENYDDSQGKYLSPWKSIEILGSNNLFGVKAEQSAVVASHDDSSISVQWSQSRQISRAMWTDDARFTGMQVLGEINTFFPTVTFFGTSTIKEIKDLLSRHGLL